MKKFLLKGIVFSMLATAFIACDSDDNDTPWVEPEVTTTGVYILNSGSSGKNNAILSYYNPDTKVLASKVFQNQNSGLMIGDTGNDMVIYGSKMYILATGSNKIYITDLKGKLLKYSDGETDAIIEPLNSANQPQKPREGIAYNGKVYVTLFDGYVAQIDTTSMTIEKTVQVGSYPEQLTVAKNKLYVANSGYGSGTTVSEVDLSSFTETRKIPVVVNPTLITKDDYDNVYVISMGNYGDIKPAFQKININNYEVSTIASDIATLMVAQRDRILLAKHDYMTGNSKYLYYNLKTNEIIDQSFLTLPSSINALNGVYSMTVDPLNYDIYISTSDYSTNGDMYIFSADGTYKNSFDTGGINAMGAYFVTGVK